jgi:hypothetical protein
VVEVYSWIWEASKDWKPKKPKVLKQTKKVQLLTTKLDKLQIG